MPGLIFIYAHTSLIDIVIFPNIFFYFAAIVESVCFCGLGGLPGLPKFIFNDFRKLLTDFNIFPESGPSFRCPCRKIWFSTLGGLARLARLDCHRFSLVFD